MRKYILNTSLQITKENIILYKEIQNIYKSKKLLPYNKNYSCLLNKKVRHSVYMIIKILYLTKGRI